MTIAQAFNEIAVSQGGTASKSGAITGAIDALNDALAGSDQESAQTIEGAVRLLGQHIGGGSSVTVEALNVTENNTYTAPEGKAYSPVTVNVPSTPSTYTITCYEFAGGNFNPISSIITLAEYEPLPDDDYTSVGDPLSSAAAGTLLYCSNEASTVFDSLDDDAVTFPMRKQAFVMPACNIVVVKFQ